MVPLVNKQRGSQQCHLAVSADDHVVGQSVYLPESTPEIGMEIGDSWTIIMVVKLDQRIESYVFHSSHTDPERPWGAWGRCTGVELRAWCGPWLCSMVLSG